MKQYSLLSPTLACTAFLLLLFVSSCNNLNDDINIPIEKGRVSLSDEGYLVFESFDSFNEILGIVNEENNNSVIAELSNLRFTSMQAIFENELDKLNKKISLLDDSSEEDIFDMRKNLTLEFPDVFILTPNNHLTMNIYRADISSLVNPKGHVKVGGVLFKYSYDELKSIANCERDCEVVLDKAAESNESISLFVSKAERSRDGSNLRTSFQGSCSSIKAVQCADMGPRDRRQLISNLILTTISEPRYIWTTCVDYDPQGRRIEYECYVRVGTDVVNYFEGTANAEARGCWFWHNWQPDNDYQLNIKGTYNYNGSGRSFDRVSNAPTSSFRYQIFRTVNQSTADITDARITFSVVNDPHGRSCLIPFN